MFDYVVKLKCNGPRLSSVDDAHFITHQPEEVLRRTFRLLDNCEPKVGLPVSSIQYWWWSRRRMECIHIRSPDANAESITDLLQYLW